MLVQNQITTLEELLECSLLMDGQEVFKALKPHFKSLEWTKEKPRKKIIYMMHEIRQLKKDVKILGHRFNMDQSLTIKTDHGEMRFFK